MSTERGVLGCTVSEERNERQADHIFIRSLVFCKMGGRGFGHDSHSLPLVRSRPRLAASLMGTSRRHSLRLSNPHMPHAGVAYIL